MAQNYQVLARNPKTKKMFGEWYPGDGICPSKSQSGMCYKTRFDYWCHAVSTFQEDSESLWFHIEAFLDLLDNVPLFFHSPPKGVNLTGGTARLHFISKQLFIQNAISRGSPSIIFSVVGSQNPWSIRHGRPSNHPPKRYANRTIAPTLFWPDRILYLAAWSRYYVCWWEKCFLA